MKRKKTLRASLAFTLVELLVVIAIIAMLVLILLPAISGTRESARRAQCISKMGKLMLATHDYEMNHGTFPAGTTHDQEFALSVPQGKQLSWTAQLLPYLDENVAFRAIDQSKSVYDETNLKIRQRKMPPFICPSASTNGTVSNYAASHAGTAEPIGAKNNGVFFVNSSITRNDISDGMQYTAFFGEKRIDGAGEFGWLAGNRSTLRNTGWPISHRLPGVPKEFYQVEFDIDHPDTKVSIPDSAIGDPADADSDTDPEDGTESDPSESDVAGSETADIGGAESSINSERLEEDDEIDDPFADIVRGPVVKLLDFETAQAIKADRYVGGFGSEHREQGAVIGLGDGTAKYFSIGTDPHVLKRLGNRADNELISSDEIQ